MSWYNPVSWIGSSDGRSQEQLQAESDAADARLAELNQAAASRYGTDWLREAENNRLNSRLQVEDAVQADFNSGLSDGYNNVTGAIKDTVNFPLKFLWDALPWWAWLAAAGGVFLYLGGGVWLKGRLAK